MAQDYYDEDSVVSNKDFLKVAQEELKRVEHQVYVTLKYTRTVDVLLNVQNRMIAAYVALIDSLLILEDKDIVLKQISVLEKVAKINTIYTEPPVKENMDIYLLIRQIVKAKNITKASEYRRPVNLKTIINGEEIEINIDVVTHYYAILMSFYKYVELLFRDKEVVEDQ